MGQVVTSILALQGHSCPVLSVQMCLLLCTSPDRSPGAPQAQQPMAVHISFLANAEYPAGNDLPEVTWPVRAEPGVTS